MPDKFKWSENAHNIALLYNGKVLARVSRNNGRSNCYTISIGRFDDQYSFRTCNLQSAKSQAAKLARKHFTEFREYERSQPTPEYVNRIISPGFGKVVRIEPAGFDRFMYRLTFESGRAVETKIPKF